MVREAQFSCALETEDGERYADPSEDHIFDVTNSLRWPDRTYFTIEEDGADWYVVVTLLEEGGYEVEYKNPARSEHRVQGGATPSDISHDVTIWIAGL